ncbi:phage tail protein [Litorimonas sp. WD9-15]|uniref:phage tail protein n=1 Tax=Litorimonas sp. WD9-15 TaxID=3418716 RepID=UPI003D04B092
MKIKHLLLSASMVAATTSISTTASAGTDAFIAETMTFGGNFCPRNWAAMDGQLLAISQNSALFSLIGTTFGGDGRTTFGLPDTRGRAMIGEGTGAGLPNVRWGERGGSTSFTLTQGQMPVHTHTNRTGVLTTRAMATSTSPQGNVFANAAENTYAAGPARGNFMDESTLRVDINNAGGSQSVSKRSPYLGMTQCIALFGIFPSRN